MADYRKIVSAQLDFETGQAEGFDFNVPNGPGASVQRLILKADADVYIAFEGDAANTESFLLEASDEPVYIDCQVSIISALGKTQSGKLYILGIR